MRLAFMAAALFCAGCVTFPVPPADMGGMKSGQLGKLRVQLTAKWEPNWMGVLQAAMNRPQPAPKSLTK